MTKPVEQSAGKPFRAKDLGSLLEGKIAGHHGRVAFVTLADNLEEQFGKRKLPIEQLSTGSVINE